MPLLCVAATARELTAFFPELHGRVPEEHSVAPVRDGLFVCLSGTGPVNAGIALGRALALNPDITAVLNFGLAGSFDLARASLGACTVVTEEIFPEYGLASEEGTNAADLGFAQWNGPDGPVFDRLPLCTNFPALGLRVPPNAAFGPSLTVAGVTASAARAARLAQRHAPLSENMEGFAVALACARAAVPCAELRVISNKVGSRAEQYRAFEAALAQLGAIGHNLWEQDALHCRLPCTPV